jgi:dihydrofolate synthase / folylpolyglutamate synthase
VKVTPVRTERVSPGSVALTDLLDRYVPTLEERSVVAIASKVVSLCENRIGEANRSKAELVRDESSKYLATPGRHGFEFTISRGTLIPAAGIDESNVGGGYLLWPEDPQRSANEARAHLSQRDALSSVGVVITDSTCMPLRRGTSGGFVNLSWPHLAHGSWPHL